MGILFFPPGIVIVPGQMHESYLLHSMVFMVKSRSV